MVDTIATASDLQYLCAAPLYVVVKLDLMLPVFTPGNGSSLVPNLSLSLSLSLSR